MKWKNKTVKIIIWHLWMLRNICKRFYKKLYHTAGNISVFLHVGSTLCWGSNVETSYRFYEHGLHLGSAALGNKKCHLANDETEIMLKSHYTRVHETGRSATSSASWRQDFYKCPVKGLRSGSDEKLCRFIMEIHGNKFVLNFHQGV